jgi:hypothetical protein
LNSRGALWQRTSHWGHRISSVIFHTNSVLSELSVTQSTYGLYR